MSITQQQALDAMFAEVKAVIDANSIAIWGYLPDVRYPGVPKNSGPDVTKLWVRVSAHVVTDGSSSLAGGSGRKLYEATGLLSVQLFCPRNTAGSRDSKGLSLAEAIRSAFRTNAASGEIWFTNARIDELPETFDSYPINVVVQFDYRTVF